MSSSSRAVTVKDVPAAAFIKEYALHLKRSNWLKLPTWVDLVKTASFKEMCPQDPDWYYVRAASVARKIYLRNGMGLGGMKDAYGGPARRGPRPTVHKTASGSVLRHIVKQLSDIGVVELNGTKGGRRITQHGQRDLDRIAGRVANKLTKKN
eukprot:TRINITY_DN12185_c0_g1_i1.p1 TRINITY_DN12185_c0_g1~~TRINITY_DN12185_c0_g1_i1.p1  ORF type:complete len:152 (+),score=38.99 TRINITY_DN12185_c0_g1_i1:32-487(+)